MLMLDNLVDSCLVRKVTERFLMRCRIMGSLCLHIGCKEPTDKNHNDHLLSCNMSEVQCVEQNIRYHKNATGGGTSADKFT